MKSRFLHSTPFITTVALVLAAVPLKASWKPAPAPIMTKWAAEVNPEKPWPEYPRPLLMRGNWQNLNGLWDYAVTKVPDLVIPERSEEELRKGLVQISTETSLPLVKKTALPSQWSGQILVPYPIESALSGVGRPTEADEVIWYRRTVQIGKRLPNHRVMLNFEGIDWHATVWVNGKELFENSGCHQPFSVDITDALGKGDQAEIVVRAWDPSSLGPQPRGKQHVKPAGYWYTRVSGIWQTVWLEQVPTTHVTRILAEATPDLEGLEVLVKTSGNEPQQVTINLKDGEKTIQAVGKSGSPIRINIPNARLWSPDSPALYDFSVSVAGETVSSYAGIRRFEKRPDESGIPRIYLNGKQIYLCGTLDQGWWPDGLYLAPTDAALRYDVEITKQLGFNMIRKHIKVEPRRWFRHCDELGIVVWQDMPSGTCANPEGRLIHRKESLAIVDQFRGYPCIGMWIVFNEGWGQDGDPKETRTAELTASVKALDPTRLVSCASGWVDRGVGDVKDIHAYPDPAIPNIEQERVAALGEFGGVGLPIDGHRWDNRGWGYQNLTDKNQFLLRYQEMQRALRLYSVLGLCASVYTQITDVELETNGLLTYDRAVIKLPVEELAKLHRSLIAGNLTRPAQKTALNASDEGKALWRYTTQKPAEAWEKEEFDHSAWAEGEAGFGGNLPGEMQKWVRTPWTSPEIWLRREFEAEDGDYFRICHDEDAEVYLNGELVAKAKGYKKDYAVLCPLKKLRIKKGKNILAVHCINKAAGQFIDLGIVDLVPDPGQQ